MRLKEEEYMSRRVSAANIARTKVKIVIVMVLIKPVISPKTEKFCGQLTLNYYALHENGILSQRF